jgi:hypothetical protein
VLRLAEPGVVADVAYLNRHEIHQYEAWAKAVANLKCGLQKTAANGGANIGSQFENVPKDRSLLVGLSGTTGSIPGFPICIRSVRPIYLSPQGIMDGASVGAPQGDQFHVKARKGYAVGAIVSKGGHAVDGFKVIFMRIDGARLNPNDSYESDWIGGKGGGPETTLGGDGRPVIGIHGNQGGVVHSLGLVQLDLEAAK